MKKILYAFIITTILFCGCSADNSNKTNVIINKNPVLEMSQQEIDDILSTNTSNLHLENFENISDTKRAAFLYSNNGNDLNPNNIIGAFTLTKFKEGQSATFVLCAQPDYLNTMDINEIEEFINIASALYGVSQIDEITQDIFADMENSQKGEQATFTKQYDTIYVIAEYKIVNDKLENFKFYIMDEDVYPIWADNRKNLMEIYG